jgi:hypothetical protein
MLDMGNATEAEVRKRSEKAFLKHPLHKIACIGALVAKRQPEGWRIDALAPLTSVSALRPSKLPSRRRLVSCGHS